MDLNRCYERYAEYFWITFPFAAPPTFQEWAYATSAAGVSSTADERSGICREQAKERLGERRNKRESWIKEQSAILVNMWKYLFQEIETFKQPSAWLKMRKEIDKKRISKSVTQIKNKLRNMKDGYKKAKDNNSQTGTSSMYPPFYNDFEEMLGSRDVINLKYVKEVGKGLSSTKANDAEKSLQPDSPILDLCIWNIFLSGKICCPHYAFKRTIAFDCYTYHLDPKSMKTSFPSVMKQLFLHSSGSSLLKNNWRSVP